jgi:hypothetical protein
MQTLESVVGEETGRELHPARFNRLKHIVGIAMGAPM